MRYYHLQDQIRKKRIIIQNRPSERLTADIFIEPFATVRFHTHKVYLKIGAVVRDMPTAIEL